MTRATEHEIFGTIADASKVSGADFLRAMTGKPPRTAAENAESDARAERRRLIALIERAEWAKARREREELIRDASINGSGDYAEYLKRVNAPFARAAERVRERIAAFDRAVAA